MKYRRSGAVAGMQVKVKINVWMFADIYVYISGQKFAYFIEQLLSVFIYLILSSASSATQKKFHCCQWNYIGLLSTCIVRQSVLL